MVMHQKIAEVGMATNQAPGAIDWEIIPDGFIFDDRMEEGMHLDNWVDIPKDSLDSEAQMIGQKLMQHEQLQTVITCIFFLCYNVCLIAF
jgi:hypothetical protein